jgi:hypothetical protein
MTKVASPIFLIKATIVSARHRVQVEEADFANMTIALPPAPHFPNGIARTPLTDADSSRTSTSVVTNLSTQAQAGSDTATPMPSSTPSNSIRRSSDTDTIPGDTEKTDLTSTSQDALVSDNLLKLSDRVPVVDAGQEDPDISKEDDQVSFIPSFLEIDLSFLKSLRNNPS